MMRGGALVPLLSGPRENLSAGGKRGKRAEFSAVFPVQPHPPFFLCLGFFFARVLLGPRGAGGLDHITYIAIAPFV